MVEIKTQGPALRVPVEGKLLRHKLGEIELLRLAAGKDGLLDIVGEEREYQARIAANATWRAGHDHGFGCRARQGDGQGQAPCSRRIRIVG